MRSILSIIGAGGHGRVIADSATQMGCWDSIQFFDDAVVGKVPDTDWSVSGTFEDAIASTMRPGESIVVGVGDNILRLAIQDKLHTVGWQIATVIHPSAHVSKHSTIGAGSVVMAQAVVNVGSSVGSACIVNTNASIDHDCVIGSGVHISPGATLAGTVTVGDRCWIGSGATLIPGVTIGEDSIVGAGAVVIQALPHNVTSVGNPAKVLSKPTGNGSSVTAQQIGKI